MRAGLENRMRVGGCRRAGLWWLRQAGRSGGGRGEEERAATVEAIWEEERHRGDERRGEPAAFEILRGDRVRNLAG